MILFIAILIFLAGCTVQPKSISLQQEQQLQQIPDDWKQEPVVILSDSISNELVVNEKSNKLFTKQVIWYYVQKRNPNFLESIQFYESNSVQKRSRVKAEVFYPNGAHKSLKPKRFEASVEDNGDYLTSNQFYWYVSIPKYQEGLVIRTEITRPYFKPENILRNRIRNSYPTLEKVIQLSLPVDHEVKFGLENPEEYKVESDTITSDTHVTYEYKTYEVNYFKGRAIHYPEQSESAIYYSLPPYGNKSFSWADLGDYYLSQLTDSKDQEFIKDWSQQFANLNSTEVYDGVRTKIRYLADEYGIHAYIPRTAEYIIKKGYGDCKETSNLLQKVFNHLDTKSHLVLVTSPGNLQLREDYPSLGGFNHMILQVDDPKRGAIYYDPTVKIGAPDQSHFYLNYQKVFVLKDLESYVSQISESDNFINEVKTHSKVSKSEAGKWEIEGTIQLNGYVANSFITDYKMTFKNKSTEVFLKSFMNSLFEINAKDIEVNLETQSQVTLTYQSSFNDAWIPLDKGGFKLEQPSLYGGKGYFTSQETLGASTLRKIHQEDIWEFEDDSYELDTKPLDFSYAQGKWTQEGSKYKRSYQTEYHVFHEYDIYKNFRKKTKKFNTGKVWK